MERLGKKYLVVRRDGSIPRWPYFVLAAADPAAPAALEAYVNDAEAVGMSTHYVRSVRQLADQFRAWQSEHGKGDPGEPDGRGTCELVHRLLDGGSAHSLALEATTIAALAESRPPVLNRPFTRQDFLDVMHYMAMDEADGVNHDADSLVASIKQRWLGEL